ncbi:MAG: Asp-tRNA(Asn)/Glu-tRNA(Gln) amidotransferase subunit GatC [Patescibacteria group bacterium]
MATTEEVKKLAALARIRIEDSELEKFTSEFDAILAYVGQLEKLDLPTGSEREKPLLHNVMREDGEPRMKSDFKRGEPHSANDYTPALIEEFPAREGDALSVKQIITHE